MVLDDWALRDEGKKKSKTITLTFPTNQQQATEQANQLLSSFSYPVSFCLSASLVVDHGRAPRIRAGSRLSHLPAFLALLLFSPQTREDHVRQPPRTAHLEGARQRPSFDARGRTKEACKVPATIETRNAVRDRRPRVVGFPWSTKEAVARAGGSRIWTLPLFDLRHLVEVELAVLAT